MPFKDHDESLDPPKNLSNIYKTALKVHLK